MTRKEEIRQKAVEIQCDHYDGYYSGHIESYQEAAIDGAEWADKTMIEKACEWLQNNINDYIFNDGKEWISDWKVNTEEMLDDFKKYMKGE